MSRRGRSAVDQLGLPFRHLGNRSDVLVSSLTGACLEKLKTTADDCYRRFHVSDFGRDHVPPYCLRFATRALGGHALASTDEEGVVTVFDTRKPMLAADGPVWNWAAHNNAVYQAEWLNHDEYLATGSADHTCKVWDLQQQACVHELRGHCGSVKAIAASFENPVLLATGARDGVINLWDLRASEGSAEQRPVASIAAAHKLTKHVGRRRGSSSLQHSVTCARFSPDGFTLLSAGVDGCVKAWDTRYLSPTRRKAPEPAFTIDCAAQHNSKCGVASLDISKDGTRALVSLTSSQCLVYNLQRPEDEELGSYYGHLNTHSYYVKSCFSPDDKMFLSGSSDGRLYIWEVDRPGAPVIQMSCHRSEVNNVDWCRVDPLKIVSASDDGFIRLWRYWKYRDSVSRIECPTLPSHDPSAPANTPAAWVCCGSTRFVDSVAHDAWVTRAWRGCRDEVEEPSTDEEDSDAAEHSKLPEESQHQSQQQQSQDSQPEPRVLSPSSSPSSSLSRSPSVSSRNGDEGDTATTVSSLRPLRRTTSLPPVLPSSMARDVEVVAPCVLFGERLHGAGSFASTFAPPGAAAAAARAPVTPHAASSARLEASAATTAAAGAASASAATATAAVHATPEKLHHTAVQVDSSPLGLVGDEYRTPRYTMHGAGSPNRILQFDSGNPMKRSLSEHSGGNRRKRTRSVSTRQPTLTQLWQSWELSSSSSSIARDPHPATVAGDRGSSS